MVGPEAPAAQGALRAVLLEALQVPRRHEDTLWVDDGVVQLQETLPAHEVLLPEGLDVTLQLGAQVPVGDVAAHAAVYLEAGPEEAPPLRYLRYDVVPCLWRQRYQSEKRVQRL